MAAVTEWRLALPLCVFLVLVGRACSELCLLNADGSIHWGSLPDLAAPQSNLDYEADGERRGVLSDMARGFVNLVTPSDRVSSFIDYTAELLIDIFTKSAVIDPWEQFQKTASMFIGIMVCLSVGVAYILLVPLLGFFFGCCRCCNNCGGKRVQEPSRCPGCMRVFYTLFLLCMTGVLCAGMAYTNFSNDFIIHAYEESESTVPIVLRDIQAFSTGALEQIDYITDDEYDKMSCLIKNDANNIGNEIADPLVVYLKKEAGVQDALDAFANLTSNLDDAYMTLESINSTSQKIIIDSASLNRSLAEVRRELDALSCSGCPDSSQLDVKPYDTLPSVETQLTGALAAKVVTEQLNNGLNDALNNISTEIEETAQPALDDIDMFLTDTKKSIADSTQVLSETVSQFNATLLQVESEVKKFYDQFSRYKDYVYYSLIGVTCLTLLIVLFNVIGMAMGTFAYKDVDPMERSRMSNAGGNVLMAGVVFSVIFGPILMLICFLLFAVSGTATLACQPLSTLELFEKTIDKPGFIVPGYFLGDLIFNDSSVNLTVTSILTECQEDAALYSALRLSSLFSLEEVEKILNEEKDKVLTDLQSVIDIPTLTLVPNDLGAKLSDAFDAINLGALDPNALEVVLSQNVTTTDLTAFAQKLREAGSGNDTLQDLADELDRIQAEEVVPISHQTADLLSDVQHLATLNSTIPESIAITVKKSMDAEVMVNRNATDQELQTIASDFTNRLFDYAEKYLAQVTKQLEEDVAKCQTVRSLYDTGVGLTCHYLFDSLNTLWFTTGWCAIFLLPSLIVAVRLAKYYRIMEEEAPPKVRKAKKSGRGGSQRQDLAMEDLPEDGHHTGHDNIRLVETIGQTGMHPQQNPHYIPDDVINGYDGYNNLGRPMAPPPAYNPEDRMRENKRTLFRAMLQGLPMPGSLERLPNFSLEHDEGPMGASTSAEVNRPSMSTTLSLPPYSRHPSFESDVYPISPQEQRHLEAMLMYRNSRSSSHQASREDSFLTRQGSSMEAYPRLRRQHAIDEERRSATLLSPDQFDQSRISQQSSFEDAFPVMIPGPFSVSDRTSPYHQSPDPLFASPRPSVYCTLAPSMVYPQSNPTHILITPQRHTPSPEPHHYVNAEYLRQPAPVSDRPSPVVSQAALSQMPAAAVAPRSSILISPGAIRKQHRVVFRQPTVSPPPSPPLSPRPPPPPRPSAAPQPDLLPSVVVRPRPLRPLQRQAATTRNSPPPLIPSSSSPYSAPPPSSSSSEPPRPPPIPPPRASCSLSHSLVPSTRRSPVPVPPPRIHIQRQASQGHEQIIGPQYQQGMPPVATNSYNYDYDYNQAPTQDFHRESTMRDMKGYNQKPRVTSYL